MKYIIASDIHGSPVYAKKLVDNFYREQADRLILLGDILYHGPRNDLPAGYLPKEVAAILNPLSDKILAVKGNCDSEVDQLVLTFPIVAEYALLEVKGRALYLTHGHKDVPLLQDGDILFNGHFHVPKCEKRDNYLYMNCGSVSIPKENSPHSFVVLEDGKFVWKDLDGAEFMNFEL